MKKMELPYQVVGQVLIYKMPKEVDHHVAKELCKELDLMIEANRIKELILDFSQTEFMDSAGIGVMIGRSKMMQFREGSMSVMHMGARVGAMFRAAGLYKIVKVKEAE